MSMTGKVERYLAELERALGGTVASVKAEIVLEVRGHFNSAIANDPSATYRSIVATLGKPEEAARQRLRERGLMAPSKISFLKWMALLSLGTVVFCVAAISLLIWKFTPLIDINGEEGRIRILGGLIDLDDMVGNFHLSEENGTFSIHAGGTNLHRVEKGQLFLPANVALIEIPFKNGRFIFSNSSDRTFSWSCSKILGSGPSEANISAPKLILDLQSATAAECEFTIPAGMGLKSEGGNIDAEINEAKFSAEIIASNGKVAIRPGPSQNYRYDLSVTNGSVDDFTSSSDNGALLIKVQLSNGKVHHH